VIGTNPVLEELAKAFQSYLEENLEEHARFKHMPTDFNERVPILRDLQRALYDAGWARYGWPEEAGGLGGTAVHRALIVDLLQRNGYPPRHNFEHLDILPPALVKFGRPEVVKALFGPTIRGDILWCQGFSEPTAGSDLAALRTKAVSVDGGYRIDGHKIWTSWAKWATHCLFLARTGTAEDRHRGLSAFVIPNDTPGLQVGVIRQSNGTEELAEVFFDGMIVPEENRLGEEGEGWAVAMHILAGERGSYAWLRQSEMLPKLERLSQKPNAAEHAGAVGESLTRLLALRCRSREVLEILHRGEEPGPESSVSKVLVIDSEQHLYDVAREVLAPDIDLGIGDDIEAWQESYLYSRASSIYGGSRQIQLNVIAKLMVSQGKSPRSEASDDEAAAIRESVIEALEKAESPREALDGLDWWSYGTTPSDCFGRAAFAAWFEGQGSVPARSPALAAVRAGSWAAAADVEANEVAVAVDERRDAAGRVLVMGLDDQTKWIACPTASGEVELHSVGGSRAPSNALDPELLQWVSLGSKSKSVTASADDDGRQRALARIACAYEILGASLALLDHAVEHTNEREQFGQPLARFQAIQHLLSESQIDVAALSALCDSALEEWSAPGREDDALATVTKAFAGRVGRAVSQRALQCFGAIGFTDEHPHHLYSHRIHTLDGIFGSAYALHAELGRELIRTGKAPRGIEVWRNAP
jgi:alkylation response protein AidB-like acyl-CoA dehydrogenase